jgi:G3E family GTPase
MSYPRYIMIGGFLGAGKTTAILQLAQQLASAGKRVGLITNDQSVGLVDTQLFAASQFGVEEITGGCFCCRFNSLVEAAKTLSSKHAPEVFLAEPVGSCTDLKATVDYPLRRMYGDAYSVAPYSVLVDPIRAARVLDLRTDKSFSEKVLYIYGKQLEEADLIIINKIDLLHEDERVELEQALSQQFPAAGVHSISARDGIGINSWLAALTQRVGKTTGAMKLDYDLYAEGEALLGWLNAQFQLAAESDFDGDQFVAQLATRLSAALQEAAVEIAHLKMTLIPELSHRLQAPLSSGEVTLNLRAEGSPEVIRELTERMLAFQAEESRLTVQVKHLESFRPGRPTPTHRFVSV